MFQKVQRKHVQKNQKEPKETLRGANNILEHHNVGTGCAEDGEDDDDCERGQEEQRGGSRDQNFAAF